MLAKAESEKDSKYEKAVHDALLSFRCAQDSDIEKFLQEKAITFLDRKWCSVYLLLNQEAFENGKYVIEAYFTLSHKSMIANTETMSKTSIKKYGGFASAETLDFVLIGQLGKRIVQKDDGTYIRSDVTSKEILDLAFEVTCAASDLIPCKYVLVECGDEEKVQKTYVDYGFSFFQKDGDHNQYCKQIISNAEEEKSIE